MANVARMIDELAAVPGRILELKHAAETEDRDISLKLRQIEPQIYEIEEMRGKFAAATTSNWLPLEEEQRLGQLKSEQSRLQAKHAAINPRTVAGIQTAEDARVALEQVLRPLLKDYYAKKRPADEAALVLALDDAAKAVVGRLQGDPEAAAKLWESLSTSQALVRFDAQQVHLAELREAEERLQMDAIYKPGRQLLWGGGEGPLVYRYQPYVCETGACYGRDSPCANIVCRFYQSNKELLEKLSSSGEDMVKGCVYCTCHGCSYGRNQPVAGMIPCSGEKSIDLVKKKIAYAAWRAIDEKVTQHEEALLQLQALHSTQLAALRQTWEAASAASAAPLRSQASATVANAITALSSASAAGKAALEACSAEAAVYAPGIERIRAKLAAMERQRDTALAAQARVEQGMTAIAVALESSHKLAREVGALTDERDAALAAVVAIRAERASIVESSAAKIAGMQREQDVLESTVATALASASTLETLFRGTADAQRQALAGLPDEELAALSPHLVRTLDAVAQERAARVATERAAAERASADAAAAATRAATCVVCLDAPKTTVLLPCGHKCACAACASGIVGSLRTCPICRVAITGTVVPYE